ncbi:unnamed protein product [Hydatigera taeniaeformis]|uniref:Uncharacterized protein n=1 Tax=Hydatigena taeniaeformis TaxID=6205 RepID=A0A3P7GAK8_HYDTA|nr:unnamed protein product [Hydatigera taeniaeformis]
MAVTYLIRNSEACCKGFCTKADYEEVDAFFKEHPVQCVRTVEQALESISVNTRFMDWDGDIVSQFLVQFAHNLPSCGCYTQVPSTTELALPLATPMDTTPSGETEPSSSISIPSPSSSSATSTSISTTTHGGRRRQANVVERKFNLDFLTSPRRKLYHDWLPKVSVISKRAVAALSNVCPRLPEASTSVVQEQLSPSVPNHPTPPNLKLTPAELTLSNSPPSPEAMSDSPTELPSTETDDSPSTFHNLYQRTSMLASPFPSKLQIRSMDDDEDLAVIDQVNRRLALGQLEPSLPWMPVPPGAGLMGYPPPTTEQYSESFAEAVFHHQQQEMMSSMMMSAATSLQGGQCFFPMETALPMSGGGEAVQFGLASRIFYRSEGNAQLSPPVEDPQSEVSH